MTALEHLGPGRARLIILSMVADFYGVTADDILGKDRHKLNSRARHVAMYLTRKFVALSYPDVGRIFGRDHTTVMSACVKVHDALDQYDALGREVQLIAANIEATVAKARVAA